MKNIIEIENLSKTFKVGNNKNLVLNSINAAITQGDFVIIFGPSGCGKTTLLNTIIGLEKPSDGKILINGHNIYKMSQDKRANFRAKKFGMIYQQSYWIKSLNVLENVALPLIIAGFDFQEALHRAKRVLSAVEMIKFSNHIPTQLSGGQQQKVSLARAIINTPELIIADEPTGNLDYKAGLELMNILERINKKAGRTIIVVTHNTDYLKKYGDYKISMLDGKIIKQGKNINFSKYDV